MKKKYPPCIPLDIGKKLHAVYSRYSDLTDMESVTRVYSENYSRFLSAGIVRDEYELVRLIFSSYTILQWLENKQLYTIHPDFGKDLFGSADCVVPLEELHVPFPCVYLDVESMNFTDSKQNQIVGYFILLDSIDFSEGSVRRKNICYCSVQVVARQADGEIAFTGATFEAATAASHETLDLFLDTALEQTGLSKEHVRNALMFLAYISSSKPDIEENPAQRAIYRKTSSPLRYASVRKWDVGVRYMQAQCGENSSDSSVFHGSHASPRPHIRRAHWHTYLTGPGRSERKLLWLPPVSVGVKAMAPDDILPAVIRQV